MNDWKFTYFVIKEVIKLIKMSKLFSKHNSVSFFFDFLLAVYLSIFIMVINELDEQNCCFTISLFQAFTCFEHMCSKHVEA